MNVLPRKKTGVVMRFSNNQRNLTIIKYSQVTSKKWRGYACSFVNEQSLLPSLPSWPVRHLTGKGWNLEFTRQNQGNATGPGDFKSHFSCKMARLAAAGKIPTFELICSIAFSLFSASTTVTLVPRSLCFTYSSSKAQVRFCFSTQNTYQREYL